MEEYEEARDSQEPYWNSQDNSEIPDNVDASDEDSAASEPNGHSLNEQDSSRHSPLEDEGEGAHSGEFPMRLDSGDDSQAQSSIRRPSQNVPLTAAQLSEIQDQNERRSARSVKRKKFADETVEASLRPAYYRNRTGSDRAPPSSGSSGATKRPVFEGTSARVSAGVSAHLSDRQTKKKHVSPRSSEGSSTGKQKSGQKKAWHVNEPPAGTNPPPTNFGFGGGFEPFDQALEDNGSNPPDFPTEEGEKKTKAPKASNASNVTNVSNVSNVMNVMNVSKVLKKKGSSGTGVVTESLLSASRRAWAAMDDLKLVSALPQLLDFSLVAKYVSFSTKVDAEFLERRWEELVDDPESSRQSVEGLDRIPLDTIQRIRKMRFFTEAEEEAVKSVVAANANLDFFERVLVEFDQLFFPGRQAEDLLACWKYVSQRVKTELGREPPETNPEIPADISALRKRNRIADIQNNESCFGRALISYTAHLNYRSKHVGCEVAYLKALSERISTASLPDQQRPKFHRDHKSTLAFLSGVCVDYAVVNEEATFGYSDENTTVDIDLSLEGNIVNLVPLQGLIYLDVEGVFHIENYGFSTISINGFPLETGNDFELPDNSAVDIGTLTFQFYKNVSAVKKHVERALADFSNRSRSAKVKMEEKIELPLLEREEDEVIHRDLSDSPEESDDSSDDGVNGRQLFMDLDEGHVNGDANGDDFDHEDV